MANLSDYYSTAMSASNSAESTPSAAMASGQAMTSGTDVAKNIVIAWGILFVALAGLNIAIRQFGKIL